MTLLRLWTQTLLRATLRCFLFTLDDKFMTRRHESVPLEKTDIYSMEVLFPQYSQSILKFPYHEKYFHILELNKTMEIGFSNLFLQY